MSPKDLKQNKNKTKTIHRHTQETWSDSKLEIKKKNTQS